MNKGKTKILGLTYCEQCGKWKKAVLADEMGVNTKRTFCLNCYHEGIMHYTEQDKLRQGLRFSPYTAIKI